MFNALLNIFSPGRLPSPIKIKSPMGPPLALLVCAYQALSPSAHLNLLIKSVECNVACIYENYDLGVYLKPFCLCGDKILASDLLKKKKSPVAVVYNPPLF
jgi:hypothetical protein